MSEPEIFEETPEEDALEQSAPVEEEGESPHGPVPLEADEADVTEQEWEVGVDDEEYR